MDHHTKGMNNKWRRHYHETTSTLAWALFIFGACFFVSLGLMWPQHYGAIVFDSKVMYRSTLDVKDFWTCDPDYIDFVFDEPTLDEHMIQMYVLTVENPKEIVQVGFKPRMLEKGPYGYAMVTHKYDVTFEKPRNTTAFQKDDVDGTVVYFREFSLLEHLTRNDDACERWFYRMDRTTRTAESDYTPCNPARKDCKCIITCPCPNGERECDCYREKTCKCFEQNGELLLRTETMGSGKPCQCSSHDDDPDVLYDDDEVLVLNPLFLKLIYKETSHALIAEWSADIFSQIRETMTTEFPEAVKSHLVTTAFLDITLWRDWMGVGTMMATALNTLLDRGANYFVVGDDDATFEPSGVYNRTMTMTEIIDGFGVYTDYLGDGVVEGLMECGLLQYEVRTCPMTAWKEFKAQHDDIDFKLNENIFYKDYAYVETLRPSWEYFFNISSPYSFLNDTVGMSRWIVICTHLDLITFQNGNPEGYITITPQDQEDIYDDMVNWLLDLHLPRAGTVMLVSDDFIARDFNSTEWHPAGPHANASRYDILLARSRVQGIALWIQKNWITAMNAARRKNVMLKEFMYTSEPVPCDPLLTPCIWQWGHMVEHFNARQLSEAQAIDMVNPLKRQLTNPLSLSIDGNGAVFYNAFAYCTNNFCTNYACINEKPADNAIECFDISPDTFQDFNVTLPASLWGSHVFEQGLGDPNGDSINKTRQEYSYRMKNNSGLFAHYTFEGCNLSTLLHHVYKDYGDFHPRFIRLFMNRNRDPIDSGFNHTFTADSPWEDYGYAQWGGGYITASVVGVRAIYKIKRTGMWWIGRQDFHERYLEYATWASVLGFPFAKLPTVADARLALDTLARQDRVGKALRQHITHQATTVIGNGVNEPIGGVGEIFGERAYAGRVDMADYLCSRNRTYHWDVARYLEGNEELEQLCELLDRNVTSSAEQCQYLEDTYVKCKTDAVTNRWLRMSEERLPNGALDTHCGIFATSIGNAEASVIACDKDEVRGNLHNRTISPGVYEPYRKKLGTMVYNMLYSLTQRLVVRSNLWCLDPSNCDFDLGGMFVRSSVRKLLFEGITDPTYLLYYNKKHFLADGLRFECANRTDPTTGKAYLTKFDAYGAMTQAGFEDVCGREWYNCSRAGITLHMPGNTSFTFTYGTTSPDKFFAPEILYSRSRQRLLWPHDMNATVATTDTAIVLSETESGSEDIITLVTPYFAIFPDFHTGDEKVNKFFQSQGRMFTGWPNTFLNDISAVDTGLVNTEKGHDMLALNGNHTTMYMSGEVPLKHGKLDGLRVTGAEGLQHRHFGWNAQNSFPYAYFKNLETQFDTTDLKPVVWSKLFQMPMSFSQFGLTEFSKTYNEANGNSIEIPMRDTKAGTELAKKYKKEGKYTTIVPGVRRFVETAKSWADMQPVDDGRPVVGTARDPFDLTAAHNKPGPRDSYGMPYRVPLDMVPLEARAGFPLFLQSARGWVNKLWVNNLDDSGGSDWIGDGEHAHVTFNENQEPAEELHQSFVDIDPVTGRTYRQVIRMQLTARIERSPLMNNIISSQGRCSVPSRVFTSGSGYGCFSYIPMLYVEEARVIRDRDVERIEDHFYTRLDRYSKIMIIGMVVGVICMIAGYLVLVRERYYRNRFTKRVYVD